MGPWRSKSEIIYKVLEICRGEGANKTKIVYQANLNFRKLNPYLALMIEDRLLEVLDGPAVLYRTTEKGYETLERLKEINALIPKE
jgi:predicted transcriptional regulator